MARRQEASEVKPLDVDGVRTVAIITVLWAVAFVVLVLRRAELEEAGRGWWIWTCLAGVGFGLLGLEYCRKRRDAIARAELYQEAEDGFDSETDWATGELAGLAEDDHSGNGRDDEVWDAQHAADAAPDLPAVPPPPHPGREAPNAVPPPPHPGREAPTGRPPPGYVTGDLPVVPPPPPSEPAPPRTGPAQPGYPRQPAEPAPRYQSESPAGYSPQPDEVRRHPRDQELERLRRHEPSQPELLRDEPPARPRRPEPDSEFFADLYVQDNAPEGPDFLLDEDVERPTGRRARHEPDSKDDPPGGEYRGRRARRD